jgi:hypothetical protein
MSDVRDAMPRSTMTTAQQRRIGSLQAAKTLLRNGTGYSPSDVPPDPAKLLRLAKWIEGES